MTEGDLRDYFAGQALPAIVGNILAAGEFTEHVIKKYGPEKGYIVVAKLAYQFADAMIAARSGGFEEAKR